MKGREGGCWWSLGAAGRRLKDGVAGRGWVCCSSDGVGRPFL